MEQKTTSLLGVKFDKSLDLKTVAMFFTVVASAFASYYGIKGEIEQSSTDRKEIHTQINSIMEDRRQTKDTIFKLLQANHDVDESQNNRLENFSDRIKQLLDMQAEQSRQNLEGQKLQAAMHEDLTLLKYALKSEGHRLPNVENAR